jgi:hypothetical protein
MATPPILASGLPGKREDPIRAGIIPIMFILFPFTQKKFMIRITGKKLTKGPAFEINGLQSHTIEIQKNNLRSGFKTSDRAQEQGAGR